MTNGGGFTSPALAGYTSGNAGAGGLYLTRVTVINNSTATALWLDCPGAVSSIAICALIYDGSHSALLGSSAIASAVVAGGNRFALSAPVVLTAGNYYIGYVCNQSLAVSISTGSNNDWYVTGQTAASPPNPLVGGIALTSGLYAALEYAVTGVSGWADDYTNGASLSGALATLDAARTEGVRSVTTHNTASGGKYYVEILLGGTLTGVAVGVMAASSPLTTPSSSNKWIEAIPANGVATGTTTVSTGVTYVSGDVIGLAYDATTRSLWINKNNGAWGGNGASPNPSTGVSGIATGVGNWPALIYAAATNAATFGLRDTIATQSYAAPSGFGPWMTVLTTISGVSATAGIGSLAPIRVTQAGASVFATNSAPPLFVTQAGASVWINPSNNISSINVTLSGVAASGQIGTPSAQPLFNVTLSGLAASGQIGALSLRVDAAISLGGLATTGQIGSLSTQIIQSASPNLAGLQTTAAIGTITSNIAASSLGAASTASVGVLSPTWALDLAGVQATSGIGALLEAIIPRVIGVATQSAVANPVPSISQSISGVATSGDIGSLSTYISTISGVESIAAVNAPSVLIGTPLNRTLTGFAGTGVEATTGVGTFGLYASVNYTSFACIGVEATTGSGAPQIEIGAPLSGVQANAASGHIRSIQYHPGFEASAMVCEMLPQPDSNPSVSLRWSPTRGASWLNAVDQSLGSVGKYRTNLQWRRLGIARDMIFELSWSTNVPTALSGLFVNFGTGI